MTRTKPWFVNDVRARIAVNALLVFPALIWLGIKFESQYISLFLPVYQWVLGAALPDYAVVALSQSSLSNESVIAATVLAVREQIIGAQHLPPGFSVTASTLSAHALKHVIIMLLLILIWPRINAVQRIARVFFCIPFLVVVEMMDIPLVLASAVNDLVEVNVAPELAANSWLIGWTKVMDGGGRIVLSIVAVLSASLLHERLLDMWRAKTIINRNALV